MQNHQKIRALALITFMAGATGLAAALPAAAQWNKPVKAKAGKTTEIYNVGIYNIQYCSPEPVPNITRMQAQNGTIKTRILSAKFSGGKCKGKDGRFLVFFYTPNPGFRGNDTAQISYAFRRRDGMPSMRAIGQRITIIVE
ncbi:MAG: hypothetical protein R3D35_02340 [Nitratireductor sp.]